MIKDCKIISLDLETSGIVPGKHVPLSIGAVKLYADLHGHLSVSSFYVQLEWDSLVVDPKAMKINGLDIANPPGWGPFDHNSLPADEGLSFFAKWLGDDYKIVALGKNVGSFDLPMLKGAWGCKASRPWPFSYRSIDLNTLFFTLADLSNQSFAMMKDRITSRSWRSVDETDNLHGLNEHHALADAWWNVFAWQDCLECLQNLKGR